MDPKKFLKFTVSIPDQVFYGIYYGTEEECRWYIMNQLFQDKFRDKIKIGSIKQVIWQDGVMDIVGGFFGKFVDKMETHEMGDYDNRRKEDDF